MNRYLLLNTLSVMNSVFFPSMIILQKMIPFPNTFIVQCGVL